MSRQFVGVQFDELGTHARARAGGPATTVLTDASFGASRRQRGTTASSMLSAREPGLLPPLDARPRWS